MIAVPFVDAHAHFWRLDAIRYPWLTPPFADDGPNGSVEAIARDYRPADHRAALTDWNLVGVVHVEAGADEAQALGETRWLERLADAESCPDAIVAFARLDDEDVDRHLAQQAAHPRVRGIRQIVNWHPDPRRTYTPADMTRDERWQSGFARLAAHGLSFDLQCYPAQMPAFAPLLARHPEVPVIVNHLGMPIPSDPDGLADWRRGLRMLAEAPQVSLKLSGLGFIDRHWTYDGVRPLLEEAVAIFGTARCLFASDAPTDTLFAPLDRYRHAYLSFAEAFAEEERRDLWGRNANRIYRLGLEI